jgi:septal ring factor EnvC (AmiA/AmiB activator)
MSACTSQIADMRGAGFAAKRPAWRHATTGLLIALGLAPAHAQVSLAPPGAQAAINEDAQKRERELSAAREQQKKSIEQQERLKAELAAIGQDRGKLNAQLIEAAARVRAIETGIDAAQRRLGDMDAREQGMRVSLQSRRGEIVEVLSALQRAGRRTPPALLVRPEDALQSLRTAILLGAIVPEIRSRADRLAADISELVALRRTIQAERDTLGADREKLRADQTRLAALVDERQKQQNALEKDAAAEAARAAALAKQVDSLQSLIGAMEQGSGSAAKAAQTASLQSGAAASRQNPGALKDPRRLTPAIAFASAKGLFALPVNGERLRNFGAPDGIGGVSKGISISARPDAQVTSPCDAWVVYAGPFRSYGQLLILNAGGGYHVLIAGMERISVSIGQFVLTGEPVATMGSTSQVASVLATNASQPVLYVEFRKDGTPIDPSPWWAATEGEKVRG